jgi:small redox-active disulfide protein 2
MNGDIVHTVKVLGPGCRNCERLTAVTEQALSELGQPERVEKVTDPAEIVALGIYSTPALMVDDELVMAARIPGVESLKGLLGDRLG